MEPAQRADFDFILMDCQMPVLDGLSATRLIRDAERRSGRARTPILAVTANAFEGDRQDCLGAGIDDYLSKPFSQQQLYTIIGKLLPNRAIGSRSPAPSADPALQPAFETIPAALADETAETAGVDGPGVLDRTVLANLRSELSTLFGRVIAIYLEHAPGQGDALVRAIEQKNPEAVRIAAHTLKSSSANIGARKLARQCGALEVAARAGKLPDNVEELGAGIATALADVLEAVKAKSAAPADSKVA